jgi:transposase
MEASGVYTDPVYYALTELDFTEVIVVNPAHVKALKGHKTDAKDCARLAELLECGLLHGSFIPSADQRQVRDLTRYRMKVVQARASEIQRLQKALESAGIKLDSVLSDITGVSGRLMIDALIDGERRAQVLTDLAKGTLRSAGKQADLSMALAARFTDHHAMLCRLHRDQIKLHDHAITGLDGQIADRAARWPRQLGLLKSVPGFGDVVSAAWLAEIGPEPHRWFPSHGKLACWVTLCPGNNISARKRKSGRTGEAGTYIKPVLVQAAWAAIRVRGRLQARYRRLVRRFGGDKNPGAKKRRSSRSPIPCSRSPTRSSRPGSPTPTSARTSTPAGTHPSSSTPTWNAVCRSSTPAARSPSPSALRRVIPRQAPPRRPPDRPPLTKPQTRQLPEPPPYPATRPPAGQPNRRPRPRPHTGQGPLPRAHRDPVFVSGGSVRVRAVIVSDGPGRVSSRNGWSSWLGAAVRGSGDR